ncbi:hypothetical protein [Methylobacterium sp. CCH5-D2]|uniref:hypothetical protein n=1 Tax=Methylobacterium sp. CCH5-D2 TaxID=1768765 RepID=UPI0008337545|nr:hypothetical protein [Methylobacterium sp. CCH5-D2]
MSHVTDDTELLTPAQMRSEILALRRENRDLRNKALFLSNPDVLREREERLDAEDRAAGVAALSCLSELRCPPDVRAFGERHRIPTFAEATWRAGFVDGWRARGRFNATANGAGEG